MTFFKARSRRCSCKPQVVSTVLLVWPWAGNQEKLLDLWWGERGAGLAWCSCRPCPQRLLISANWHTSLATVELRGKKHTGGQSSAALPYKCVRAAKSVPVRVKHLPNFFSFMHLGGKTCCVLKHLLGRRSSISCSSSICTIFLTSLREHKKTKQKKKHHHRTGHNKLW